MVSVIVNTAAIARLQARLKVIEENLVSPGWDGRTADAVTREVRRIREEMDEWLTGPQQADSKKKEF